MRQASITFSVIGLALLCGLSIAVLTGCEEAPPPPPPEAEKPPPPTPAEIAAEIRNVIQPLATLLVGDDKGGWSEGGTGKAAILDDTVEKQVLDGLRGAKAKHQVTENGQAALATITHEIADLIRKAKEVERWKLVLGGIAAYEVMDPGNTKYRRLAELAELYRRRPQVWINGFFDDNENDDTYVFLKVKLRPSNEMKQVRVRKGEEFHNLRFAEIVGNKKGIKLEYLLIPGDTWEIQAP